MKPIEILFSVQSVSQSANQSAITVSSYVQNTNVRCKMNLQMNEWEEESDLYDFVSILNIFIQHLRFPVAHNITPNENSSVSNMHPTFWIFNIISCSMLYYYYQCMEIHIFLILDFSSIYDSEIKTRENFIIKILLSDDRL